MMAPTQSKAAVTEREVLHHTASKALTRVENGRAAKWTPWTSLMRNSTDVSLHALTEAKVSELLQDPRERHGHVLGTAYRMGVATYVCAIFDMKEDTSDDCTHWDEDDAGDDYLRDFMDIAALPMDVTAACADAAIKSSESDADETEHVNVFLGHSYIKGDPNPNLVVAWLTRNRKGHWIGENVVTMTAEIMFLLAGDLPASIELQIRQFRLDKARRDEVEQDEERLSIWAAELEKREKAMEEREMALTKREA